MAILTSTPYSFSWRLSILTDLWQLIFEVAAEFNFRFIAKMLSKCINLNRIVTLNLSFIKVRHSLLKFAILKKKFLPWSFSLEHSLRLFFDLRCSIKGGQQEFASNSFKEEGCNTSKTSPTIGHFGNKLNVHQRHGCCCKTFFSKKKNIKMSMTTRKEDFFFFLGVFKFRKRALIFQLCK